MQNKGLVITLAVCLALVSAFYLSFTFVTKYHENKAVEYAGGDEAKEKFYLDSIAKEKVWFGYTLKECREKGINLGLDLQGGMSVVMEVQVKDVLLALSNHNTSENFRLALSEATKRQGDSDADYLDLFFEEFYKLDKNAKLATIFSTTNLEGVSLNSTNQEVEDILREQVDSAIDQSFNVLSTRIDRFGVVQPNIQKLSRKGRILIELPGVKEKERVRKLLQGSANLEFWETYNVTTELLPQIAQINNEIQLQDTKLFDILHVVENAGPVVGMAHYADTAAVMGILDSQAAKSMLPREVRFGWTVKAVDEAEVQYQLVALKSQPNGRPALEGEVISDARADFEQTSAYASVSMTMNPVGASAWERITGQNIGKSIAIVLDGYVYSFPTVQNKIAGGRSQITGNFTVEEAKDLANTLNSGKMLAPAHIEEESVVGPSLGRDAIRSGMISFAIGFMLIMLYMIFYYGFIPGMIANFALLCNVFLLLGILASFSAVLTLPGIAGIVLTMGMAVDANVLIYERIREEIKAGKSMRKAIQDGFSNAISAIIDSNVTSFLTGVILAVFGSGPIKGFAVTYMIGIVSSFLTAVFICRLLLEAYAKKEDAKPLSFTTKLMQNFLQNTKVNFIGARKVTYIVSGILVVVGILGINPHIMGKLNYGIEFSGGRNYVVRFDKSVNPEDVETRLKTVFTEAQKELKNKDVFSLDVITMGESNQVRISTNYLVNDNSPKVDSIFSNLLYDGCKSFYTKEISFEQFYNEGENLLAKDKESSNVEIGIMQSQKVGASIADETKQSAIWAVLAALGVIFLYILVRFRNVAFSVGALVGLAHDAIFVLGAYAILGNVMPFSMEIGLSFIAAILTVIGYSINDTVVVFDRVREYKGLYPKRDLKLNINNALNDTLSRTFSTSMSTFVVLLAIFCLGGETIRGFVFALMLGVIIGTYSTLCVATPLAYDIQEAIRRRKEKKAAK